MAESVVVRRSASLPLRMHPVNPNEPVELSAGPDTMRPPPPMFSAFPKVRSPVVEEIELPSFTPSVDTLIPPSRVGSPWERPKALSARSSHEALSQLQRPSSPWAMASSGSFSSHGSCESLLPHHHHPQHSRPATPRTRLAPIEVPVAKANGNIMLFLDLESEEISASSADHLFRDPSVPSPPPQLPLFGPENGLYRDIPADRLQPGAAQPEVNFPRPPARVLDPRRSTSSGSSSHYSNDAGRKSPRTGIRAAELSASPTALPSTEDPLTGASTRFRPGGEMAKAGVALITNAADHSGFDDERKDKMMRVLEQAISCLQEGAPSGTHGKKRSIVHCATAARNSWRQSMGHNFYVMLGWS